MCHGCLWPIRFIKLKVSRFKNYLGAILLIPTQISFTVNKLLLLTSLLPRKNKKTAYNYKSQKRWAEKCNHRILKLRLKWSTCRIIMITHIMFWWKVRLSVLSAIIQVMVESFCAIICLYLGHEKLSVAKKYHAII